MPKITPRKRSLGELKELARMQAIEARRKATNPHYGRKPSRNTMVLKPSVFDHGK